MICADTSSLVAYIQGEPGQDVAHVDAALANRSLVIAPLSVAELLSDAQLSPPFERLILRIPQLEISPGYWERAGKLRAKLFRHRFRPRLAEVLIAQSCLDHKAPLVARDRDFSAFEKLAGLRPL